jgi:ribosomal protein S18 acetylase RimI-like enzyme
MFYKELEHSICFKQYISKKDYKQIEVLQNLCYIYDKVNLKLELEYKLRQNKTYDKSLKNINEFLYYVEDSLVGYLGISSFGEGVAEINGMVHPHWRGMGIFKRLYILAMEECNRRSFKSILLLSDDKSNSGNNFIKSTKAKYSFSEYKMKLTEKNIEINSSNITLRKALNSDAKEISRQNNIFFGVEDTRMPEPEIEEILNHITYMIELNEEVIGKIKVSIEKDSAYISGFGILPEFRKHGYGKEAMIKTLNMLLKNNINDISLDVASGNSKALDLYKCCGFTEQSVMNYYEADR